MYIFLIEDENMAFGIWTGKDTAPERWQSDRSHRFDRSWSRFLLLAVVCTNYLTTWGVDPALFVGGGANSLDGGADQYIL